MVPSGSMGPRRKAGAYLDCADLSARGRGGAGGQSWRRRRRTQIERVRNAGREAAGGAAEPEGVVDGALGDGAVPAEFDDRFGHGWGEGGWKSVLWPLSLLRRHCADTTSFTAEGDSVVSGE